MTARAVAGAAVLVGALLHAGCASDSPHSGSAGRGGAGGTAAGGSDGGVAGAGASAGAAGAIAGSGGATGTAGATAGSGGALGGASGSAAGGQAGAIAGSGGARGGASGSAAGSSGTAGSGGSNAGSGGGTAGAGVAGSGGGPSTTLKLEYATSSATATTYSVRITNSGPATPLLSTIKARYFFSDDSANKMNGATLDSATWQLSGGGSVDLRATGGCAVISTFPAPPMSSISSYADVGCALASPLNANDTVTFTIHFDPAIQTAGNDYSYLPTAGAFQANGHMLLLQNGLIVAGTPPPS